MAFAFLQEWKDATPGTANYDAIAEKLGADKDPPEGLIAHTAGIDSLGVWRIFEIWESAEHAKRFHDERVMPIVEEMLRQAPDMSPPDRMDTYELHDLIHP